MIKRALIRCYARVCDDATDKNDFHADTMGNYDDNHSRVRARVLFVNFSAAFLVRIFAKICIADEIREASERSMYIEAAFVIAKPELVNPFGPFQCHFDLFPR